MTAQTLPDDPVYAFVPSYDLPDQPQQIRIVFEGMEGYVPTALSLRGRPPIAFSEDWGPAT